MTASTRHPANLTRSELTALLAEWGFSSYHADQVWGALYRENATSWSQLDAIRPDLRDRLSASGELDLPDTLLDLQSRDGHTRKFLLRLTDGETVEAVLMRYRDRYTACISTQAGCAMGCVFCATGQMGFRRHLAAGEIVAQILALRRALGPEAAALRNIVYMGMGEPLHNLEATLASLDILGDDRGLAFAPRHVTVSTVGIPAGIRRFADLDRREKLAVSLHASTDAEREALIPTARRWSLAELLDACAYYVERRGRRIFFEWTLIAGKNDTPEQAHRLGRLLRHLNAHVNVIPLNPTRSYSGTPSEPAAVRRFQAVLADYGLPSTVRQRRGLDIAAGCGQLRASFESPA